jgi:hypothetical protein
MLTLAADPSQPLATGPEPLAVQLATVDANPTNDLVALSAHGQLTVALNSGDDRWQTANTTNLNLGPLAGIKLATLDHDGFPDLVVQGPDSISIALGDGNGRFDVHDTVRPVAPGSLAPASGAAVQPDVSLLNGDPLPDVVSVAPGTNQVLVFLTRAEGTLPTPAYYPSGADQPVAVVVGDFVGNVAPDLAVGHADGKVTFLQGAGDGTFQLHSPSTVTNLGTIVGLTAADLDDDGDTDLAVSSTDQVNLLLGDDDPLTNSPITNGLFSAGLTGWQTEIIGHSSDTNPGSISALGGFAQLRENQSFLVSLQQTFTIPPTPHTLSLDIVSLGLDHPDGGLPDAFEISLLDDRLNSLVPTFASHATSFFNVNPDSPPSLAAGVTFDGTTVTVDISSLAPGDQATLYVDLVGNPPGPSSVVSIDNVQLTPDAVYANTFAVVPLDGPFSSAAGIRHGDVDGDGRLDLVVADSSANRLVVYNRDARGVYLRSELDLSARGRSPRAVAAAPLTAGDSVDDVVIAMFGSSQVLTPLGADTTGPTLAMVDLLPGQVRTSDISQLTVQFSESVQDHGPAGDHSVTNPQTYRLVNLGPDATPDGGSGDH